MSTETPDDGAAWREWCRRNPTGSSAIATFMAGRESLAARLDALHAENRDLQGRLARAASNGPVQNQVELVRDLSDARAYIDKLIAERDALAQAIWDAYGILGFDQDGDRTPAPAIAGAKYDYAAFAEAWLIRSAREQAKDHTDLLDECTAVEAERDALHAESKPWREELARERTARALADQGARAARAELDVLRDACTCGAADK